MRLGLVRHGNEDIAFGNMSVRGQDRNEVEEPGLERACEVAVVDSRLAGED